MASFLLKEKTYKVTWHIAIKKILLTSYLLYSTILSHKKGALSPQWWKHHWLSQIARMIKRKLSYLFKLWLITAGKTIFLGGVGGWGCCMRHQRYPVKEHGKETGEKPTLSFSIVHTLLFPLSTLPNLPLPSKSKMARNAGNTEWRKKSLQVCLWARKHFEPFYLMSTCPTLLGV